MQFSPASFLFLLPRSMYLFQNSILEHSQSVDLLVRDHILYRYKKENKIVVLYLLILKF